MRRPSPWTPNHDLEFALKQPRALALILALLTLPAWSHAEGPDSGFFFGLGGNLQWVPGSGTWDQHEFDIRSPMSPDEGGAVGFSWTDKALLGIKPMAGYRLSPHLALQVNLGLNIPKTSQQSYAATDAMNVYEQGMTMEWNQRNLEILGIYQPDAELDYYFFGGIELTRVDMNVLLFEGVEFEDYAGNPTSFSDFQNQSDHITALGFILGGGVEFPSDNRKRVVFASAQYAFTRTGDTFFGTPDFKVDLGGISLTIGVKLYPFQAD
jgi:opacity protein-like surface antigen